jgi:hypothetical protein
MPRSLKKSPFIAYHLLKKIQKLNKEGKKKIPLQLGLDHPLFYLVWLGLPSQFTMGNNMYQFLFLTN